MLKGCSGSKADFLSFVVNYICDTNPEELQVMVADLTRAIQKLDPKCEANLFRKSYGNVAEVFARGRFGGALVLDGDVVKLEQPIRLSEDVLSPAVFNKCLAAHHFKQQHLIWTLALNQQNVCARCGQHYSERVAEQPLCRTHRQMIDRSTSPGVYRCCGELDHEHYVGCGNNAKHCRLYDLSGVDPSTEKSMIDPRQLRVPYANLDALATAGDGSW